MRIPKNPRYIISHLVAAVTPGEYVALTTFLAKCPVNTAFSDLEADTNYHSIFMEYN